jgi:hypothetical protein
MRVKVIFRKKQAVLVEYQDSHNVPMRVSVQATKASMEQDGTHAEISDTALKQGIPYGIPWSAKIKSVTITGEDIEREMYKNGIWTLEDLQRNPQIVQGVILSATIDLSRSIAQIAKEYSRKE